MCCKIIRIVYANISTNHVVLNNVSNVNSMITLNQRANTLNIILHARKFTEFQITKSQLINKNASCVKINISRDFIFV